MLLTDWQIADIHKCFVSKTKISIIFQPGKFSLKCGEPLLKIGTWLAKKSTYMAYGNCNYTIKINIIAVAPTVTRYSK